MAGGGVKVGHSSLGSAPHCWGGVIRSSDIEGDFLSWNTPGTGQVRSGELGHE